MRKADKMYDILLERASKGDGASSIAFAILELAYQQSRLAHAVDAAGLHVLNADGTHYKGGLEFIGMQMREMVEAINTLAPRDV